MARNIKHNFVVYRGETFNLTLKAAVDQNGNPLDLEGHTLVLTFKVKTGEVLEEYESEVVEFPHTIKVTDEETETWPLGNNKYVLKDMQPNGDVRFFAAGSITVMDAVPSRLEVD